MQSKVTRRPFALTKKAKAIELEIRRLRRGQPYRTPPIPLGDLPHISSAIAHLPPEEGRCLKFLMLSAARASEVCELRAENIRGFTWAAPCKDDSASAHRPLSTDAAAVLQLARPAGADGEEGRLVFRSGRGNAFSTQLIRRRLLAIAWLQGLDANLSSRSFRVTFAEWAMRTAAFPIHARMALGVPSEDDKMIFAKFGRVSYDNAMKGARQLLEDWALLCR